MEVRSATGHGIKDGTGEIERDTSMDKEEVIKILEDNKITNVQPPSTIHNKLKSYIDLLDTMDDMMDRYTWLMDFGKKSAIVPERFKLPEFEVPGCQSQTWLVPHFTYEDTIYFTADSWSEERRLFDAESDPRVWITQRLNIPYLFDVNSIFFSSVLPYFEFYLFSFFQGVNARCFQSRYVQKDILAFLFNKSISFGWIKPFNFSCSHLVSL
jgi:hypothetical protein